MGNLANATAVGIENLKALATGVAELSTAVGNIMKDGSIGVGDLGQVPAIFAAIRHLAAADVKAVLPEAKDLSDPERVELAAHFSAVFDLPNDTVEVIVEQGLEMVLMGLQAILSFVAIKGKAKA